MFSISGINQKLQIVTSSGADIDVTITYNDFALIDVGPINITQASNGEQFTAITTATTTDVLSAPGENISRAIHRVSIRNIDGASTNTVYVLINDNSTLRLITPSVPLAAGELYEYESGTGWRRIDSNGLTMGSGTTGADGLGYGGTSVTSITIGTGTKAFTTQTGLAYVAGQRVRVIHDTSNYVEGLVTSYTGGVLTVDVDAILGSGTYTSWAIGIAGEHGSSPTYYGTSANSLTIAGGSITFDTQAGLAYTVGQRVRLTYNSANYMEGLITAYSGNSMSVTVDYKGGSGSYNSWILSPSTEQHLPDGGTTGYLVGKASSSDYDYTLIDPASLGGGADILQVQIFS